MYWKVPVRAMFREYGFDSYLDKSYFVARWGGYVASVQVMSRDKLKHQVREQLLSRDKFIPSRDITFMSHRWLRYTMTAKHVNAAIDVFLVWLPVKYCDMLHHFSSAFVGYIIKHLFHENLCPITFWTYNNVTIIINLHRVTHLRLVALYKSLTMIVTSFILSKCNRT